MSDTNDSGFGPGSAIGTVGTPPPVRSTATSVRRIVGAPARTYAVRTGAFALAFVLVAGSVGMRIPLGAWVLHPSTDVIDLVIHVTRALVIGMASACLSVVAGNLARTPIQDAEPRKRHSIGRILRESSWTRWRAWPWLTGLALALGCAAQSRLANDPASPTTTAVTALAGLLLVGPVTFVLLKGIGQSPRRAMWVGILIGFAALGLRLGVPVLLGGNPYSGAFRGIAFGEIARAMAALSAALALTGARERTQEATVGGMAARSLMVGLLGRLLPALLMISLLVTLQDLGPAIILFLTMAVMALLAYSWAYWWRAAAVTTLLGLFFALAGWALNTATRGSLGFLEHAGTVVEERLTDGGCEAGQRTQACKSLRILHETGLFPQLREIGSGQPFGSSLVRHLEVADSDYAITLLSSWVGIAVVVVLLAAILATGLRLFLGSLELPETTEAGNVRVRIGAAAALQIMLPTAMLSLAILLPKIPGTQSKWPLTGLDVPFIAANGVSTMVYCAALALGALVIWKPVPGDGQLVARTRNRQAAAQAATVGVAGVLLVVTAGALWIHTGADSAGSVRLAGESLLRDNYTRLLTRDGTVFSEPNNDNSNPAISLGGRSYPSPDLAVDLGFFLAGRSSNQAVGLEWLAAPLLTCGHHRSRGFPPIAAECSGANVISTVDARIQRLAAEQAERFDTDQARAEVVLVERGTGAIVALASSDADNAAMQRVITQATTTSGWQPPTLLLDRDADERTYLDIDLGSADLDPEEWGRDRAAFAMRHLQGNASQCVKPMPASEVDGATAPRQANPRRPGEPWTSRWPEDLGPSRAQCERDKQGLAIMRAWYERSQPGSTFKVVTALASMNTNTPMPPSSLTPPLTEVDGQRIQGMINERGSLARCEKQTLDFMLLQSCNTTAAWLGIKAGWPALAQSAGELGFDTDQAGADSLADEGGVVLGPADPSDPGGGAGNIYYRTSEVGSDPTTRVAKQADGGIRPLTPGAVAFAAGTTAIGQDQVRASALDMAAMTHAIVGSGPLRSPDNQPSTDDQMTTEYAGPPRLNMVAGACPASGDFIPTAYPARALTANPESLALVRRGMWWAVNHPDRATAGSLRPVPVGSPARPLDGLDVIWAKTGSADLGPANGENGPVEWARWVMGGTDRYVFAARVKGYPQGGGPNPAVSMIKNLLGDLNGLNDPPPISQVCDSANE